MPVGSELLVVQTDKPGSVPVVLVSSNTVTGYSLQEASPPDFGLPSWDVYYSGARGTQGAVAAGADAQNRQLSIPLLVDGVSQDDLSTKLQTLWQLDSELRRYGGVITFRPRNGSFKMYYDVMGSSIRADFSGNYFRNYMVMATWAPVCGPYLRMDPFDIVDDFSVFTNDWTAEQNGTAGGLPTSAGGVLYQSSGQLIANATGTALLRYTGRGYPYQDGDVTMKLTTGSTVASYSFEVFTSRRYQPELGFDIHIGARITTSLDVGVRNGGTWTTLATTAFTPSTSTTYWLKFRRAGGLMIGSVYTTQPSPRTAATASVTYRMSAFESASYTAANLMRDPGFRVQVVSTAERYDDFWFLPNSYGGAVAAF